MINILKIYGFLAVLTLFTSPIGTLAMAEQTPAPKESPVLEVQIKDVVSNPGEYNGKKIALEGKVAKVDYRNSTKGEPFTIFKLKDSENNEVGVYFEDERLPLSKGDKVKIMGRFWKEKSYFLYKIKNVIKARTVDVI
ncbi:MAG: hypothetical protein L0213_05480 [Candidatus Dadabacteria bacterium]|nr:hypothetical protein [Candidatus Dadabacteria bacterium]